MEFALLLKVLRAFVLKCMVLEKVFIYLFFRYIKDTLMTPATLTMPGWRQWRAISMMTVERYLGNSSYRWE